MHGTCTKIKNDVLKYLHMFKNIGKRTRTLTSPDRLANAKEIIDTGEWAHPREKRQTHMNIRY